MDVTKTHLLKDLTHKGPLISCRFAPGDKYIFTGSEDYKVWRIEIASGTEVKFPTDAWVRGLAFLPELDQLITAGYDGRLIWWPMSGDSPTPVRTVEAHHGWVRAVTVSPDGKLVVSVGNDQTVAVFEASSGKLLNRLTGHESHIYNAAFHPAEPGQLVTGDLHCHINHWDLKTGSKVRTWQAESLQKYDKTFVATIGGFRGMTFTSDGKHLLCSGITNVSNAFAGVGNPSVVSFNWSDGKQQIEHLSKGKLRGVAWGVAALPAGIRVATVGGNGGYLLFWKPEDANEFHNMKLKDNGRDLALSHDSSMLAVAHSNGHVSVLRMDEKT